MNGMSRTALMIALGSALAACGGAADNQANESAPAQVENLAVAANEIENAAAAVKVAEKAVSAAEQPVTPPTGPGKAAPAPAPRPAAKPEPEGTPKAAPQPAPAPVAEPKPDAPAAATCTAEHRAMGHC